MFIDFDNTQHFKILCYIFKKCKENCVLEVLAIALKVKASLIYSTLHPLKIERGDMDWLVDGGGFNEEQEKFIMNYRFDDGVKSVKVNDSGDLILDFGK